MKKKETSEVVTITSTGLKVTLDISDKACLEFGFKHGDEIIDPNNNEGTIVGVGTLHVGKALWYTLRGRKGVVHYNFGNLREAGAELKKKSKKRSKSESRIH